jgi:hypothetical protein
VRFLGLSMVYAQVWRYLPGSYDGVLLDQRPNRRVSVS